MTDHEKPLRILKLHRLDKFCKHVYSMKLKRAKIEKKNILEITKDYECKTRMGAFFDDKSYPRASSIVTKQEKEQ